MARFPRPRTFNLWVCRAALADRFKVGTEYAARRFTHRFISKEPSSTLLPGNGGSAVVTGVCSAVEIIDDNGSPLVFTEHPSAQWHRPYAELASYFDTSPVIKNVSVPPCLKDMEARAGFTFKPAQADTAARLATMNSALLYADVGTGKTPIMLGVLDILRPRRVLVVAKRGLVAQWIKETERFGSHLRAQRLTKNVGLDEGGLFVTYPHEVFYDSQDLAAGQKFDVVIYDEAHEVLGNIESHQCRRALKLTAPRRYALTGTPYSNNVDNLFPILGWLSCVHWSRGDSSPDFPFKKWDVSRYRHTFGGGQTGWSGMVAAGNLASVLEPFLVRLTKDDCSASAPRITIHVHRVELEADRRREYDMLSDLRAQGLKAFSSTSQLRELVLTLGVNKWMALTEQISMCCLLGVPQVVVSPRHAITDQLSRLYDVRAIIDGRTRKPADEAQRFKDGETDLLFMGTRCAQGYSFGHCNQLILTGLDFSLASFWQTVGRVWRMDSVKDAHVHMYLYSNTIEENVLNRVLRRYDVSYALFGGTLPNVVVQMDS